jgi:hypothetical protein
MGTQKVGNGELHLPHVAKTGLIHKSEVPLTDRHQHIAVAAYFIAEHRDFVPGHELDDWLQAEAVVSNSLQ